MAATTETVQQVDQAKQAVQDDAHAIAAAHTGINWAQIAQYFLKFLEVGGDVAVEIGPFIPGVGPVVVASGAAATAVAKTIEEHTS